MKRVRGASLATAEEGDFMCDIGGKWTAAGEALTYARGKLVCDARAAKMTWLVDGAFMQLADEQALECESRLARTHGFNGKVAIHPRQVKTINQVFRPPMPKSSGLKTHRRLPRSRISGAARFNSRE